MRGKLLLFWYLVSTSDTCLGPDALCLRGGECCQPLVCQLTNKPYLFPNPGIQQSEGVNHLHEKLLMQLPTRYSTMVDSDFVSVPLDKNRTRYHLRSGDPRHYGAKRCAKLPVLIDTYLITPY